MPETISKQRQLLVLTLLSGMLLHTNETRVSRTVKIAELGSERCVSLFACKQLSAQPIRIIKVKKPLRKPGHEGRVCCQQSKELWKRRSEKMRGKGEEG